MLLAFKDSGAEDVFQKYRLKDVLRVGMILQMQRAHPPNGIRIPFHGLNRLLFAPHGLAPLLRLE